MGDLGSADWGLLGNGTFKGTADIVAWTEIGRNVAMNSADVLDAALRELYKQIIDTDALGGHSLRNKAKAKRLVSPMLWVSHHQLSSAQKRFAQLPGRFEAIWEEELRKLRSRSGNARGMDL